MRLSLAMLAVVALVSASAQAEVIESGENGFQIRLNTKVAAEPAMVSKSLEHGVDQWWNKDHTYTGDSSNLSFDYDRHCFLEKLPKGGFVRHLEIVYYEPGKRITFSGGLGPLQPMGATGALTMSLKPVDDGKATELEWTYHVSGFAPGQFKVLAPAVDMVLSQQMKGLQGMCEAKN